MSKEYQPIKRNYQMIRYDQLISPHDNDNPGFNRGYTGISRAQVNKIKREYDPQQVEPVLVSFRGGKYYVMNGQHTSLAIYELNGEDGATLIYCDVREGLTAEQEADLFLKYNTNKRPLSKGDIIWASVCAGDTKAIAFKDLIERCGYKFGRKSATTIGPIGVCWDIFKERAGVARLENILTLIHDTWPSNTAAVHGKIVRGLDLFFKYHEYEFDREHFVKVFARINYKDLVDDAAIFYRAMNEKSYTHPVCVYHTVVQKYNKNLRTRRLRFVQPN